jgi:PleD family two-component response regulator
MVLRPGSFDEMGIAVERIRQTMNDAAASMARGGRATVSAGAAMLADADEDLDDSMRRVVRAADDALYTAKRSGRNRTALAEAPRLTMVSPRTA